MIRPNNYNQALLKFLLRDKFFAIITLMKVVASFFLTLLLSVIFLSLFHMSMGKSMMGSMPDCPTMAHEEVICPMSLADAIGAWKAAFLAVVPGLTLLLAAAGLAVFVTVLAPNLLRRIVHAPPPQYQWIQARTYTFTYRSLQEMFSNGILHPKLF